MFLKSLQAELLTLRTSFGQKQQELNEALSKLQALV